MQVRFGVAVLDGVVLVLLTLLVLPAIYGWFAERA
jgi:hypothetical protein